MSLREKFFHINMTYCQFLISGTLIALVLLNCLIIKKEKKTMSVIKWSPIRTFSNKYVDDNPYFQMDNLINYIFNDRFIDNNSSLNWNPNVDIFNNDKEYEINIETPGMKKNDFKINLTNQVLHVNGEKKSKNSSKNYIESKHGVFYKKFKLNEDILAKNIKASYVQGILKITIPKSKSSKIKNIEIEVK